jgi:hypothetical protein
MGDNEGPFFGSCEEWSIPGDEKSMEHCEGVLSTGGKVAMGIGIPIGSIVLIAVGIWADKTCHKRRKAEDSELIPSGTSN